MAVPNTFASSTSAIPLANLDANFSYYDTAYSIVGTTVSFNGNVGIGVTPSAWRLDVKSAGTNVVTNGIRVNRSSVTTQYGVTNYEGGAFNNVCVNTAGTGCNWNVQYSTDGSTTTQPMTLDASGNLGIGTTSTAGYALAIQRTSDNALMKLTAVTAGGAGIDLINAGGSEISYINASGNNVLTFRTGTTERMRIDSSGNLGIGTTSPTDRLDIRFASGTGNLKAGVTAGNNIKLYNTVGDLSISTSDATSDVIADSQRNVIFKTANTERARIDSSGNLLIGTTTSGAYKLDVSSSSTTVTRFQGTNANGGYVWYQMGGATPTSSGYVGSAKQIVSGGAVTDFGITATANLVFGSNDNTERARIDTGGNFLVGTSSTSLTAGTGIKLQPTGQNATTPGLSQVGSSSANTENTLHVYSTGAAAYRFYVGYGGTISATSTTITAISDQRLKENIRDLDDGLDKVLSLKPRKFDWKEGKGADIKNARGFIAQEFETVFPDMIEQWLDEPPEGEEPYKAINANLIPTLVKAIQEQQALIQSLTDRLTALENK